MPVANLERIALLKISVSLDISKALARLNAAREQVPFATALALTKTAQAVQGDLVDAMKKVFKSPTPFTMNSLYVKSAKKSDLTAYVWVKDRQRRYLLTEIEGGPRSVKGFESLLIRSGVMPSGWYAVPASGAPLDQYGNVSGALIGKLLSQLQSARDSLQNESLAKKQRRNRRNNQIGSFFAVQVGQTSHLRPGIYMRQSMTARGGLVPIFMFVSRAPSYRARFDFYGVGAAMARQRFPLEFDRAITVALRTAR
jgi:hypothetical protein